MSFLNYNEYKKYLILNLIYELGPISRTRLAEITGYIPTVITNIVKEMLDEQLIVESGSLNSGLGRRRMLLSMNNEYICALGISISMTSILFIVNTINGDILKRVERPLPKGCTSKEIINTLLTELSVILKDFEHHRILGIGICDPGIWDAENDQSIYSVRFKDWKNIPLKSLVTEATHLPVMISGGNSMIPLGEQHFGCAQGINDLLCIELGNGIGSNFMCNGMAIRGHNGFAGEIGHTIIDNCSEMCYCGNSGCMEQNCALPYIKNSILASLRNGVFSLLQNHLDSFDDLSIDDILWAIERNDNLCSHYVFESAARIGIAVANLINILDPECIVFYGELTKLGDCFIEEIKRSAKKHVIPFARTVDFRVSTLGDSIRPLGASTVIFQNFLKSDSFLWINRFNKEVIVGTE